MTQIQWWGYLHTEGTLQVKRYFGPEDLREAEESPFVKKAFGPWSVIGGREEAEVKLTADIARWREKEKP